MASQKNKGHVNDANNETKTEIYQIQLRVLGGEESEEFSC